MVVRMASGIRRKMCDRNRGGGNSAARISLLVVDSFEEDMMLSIRDIEVVMTR